MTAEVLGGILGILILLIVIARVLRIPGIGSRSAAGVFFLFADICLVFDECYWLIYDLLRAEIRMPIAANEIGEAAAFLLLSAEIRNAFPKRTSSHRNEIVASVLFVASSIALWIAWTGEWLQDIVGGAAFGYLLCVCVIAMKDAEILSKTEWRILLAGAAVLIALEAGTLLPDDRAAAGMDLAAYLLMAAGEVLLFAKAVSLFRREAGYRELLAVSFAGFVYTTSCFYMSSSGWYVFHVILNHLYQLMMCKAVIKEAREQ